MRLLTPESSAPMGVTIFLAGRVFRCRCSSFFLAMSLEVRLDPACSHAMVKGKGKGERRYNREEGGSGKVAMTEAGSARMDTTRMTEGGLQC